MADDDYCYLTTTGRRTGNPHRIEIWYAAAPGVLYLLAGGGRRSDWVQNLVAEPRVLVEIDGEEHRATGRVIEDADEDGACPDARVRQVPAAFRRRPHRVARTGPAGRTRPRGRSSGSLSG